MLFRSGEPYWDGGYAANPAVFPLFYECSARDIVLVLLSPLKYSATPHTAVEIRSRVLELAFTSSFLREMRMFAHLRELISESWFTLGRMERRLTRTHFHVIDAQEQMSELTAETKMAATLPFFEMLKAMGRERARAWLQTHYAQIGQRSSVDLSELFY